MLQLKFFSRPKVVIRVREKKTDEVLFTKLMMKFVCSLMHARNSFPIKVEPGLSNLELSSRVLLVVRVGLNTTLTYALFSTK